MKRPLPSLSREIASSGGTIVLSAVAGSAARVNWLQARRADRDGKERKEYLCHKCFFQVSLECLLSIIEIKAVQNAMGKRGCDQGCDADKN